MGLPSRERTEVEFRGLFDRLCTWGRWGEDDDRGALNYITGATLRAAAAEIRDGESLSLALPLRTDSAIDNPRPPTHLMVRSSDAGGSGSSDYLAMEFHGLGVSHLDALCHVFFDDRMYNGRPRGLVTSLGAKVNTIESLRNGIATRGILLDVPRALGLEWLEPGFGIEPDHLQAAEKLCSTRVQPGDAVLIRTGRFARRDVLGPWDPHAGLAGLEIDCLTWLYDRQVAILGSDGVSEVIPHPVPHSIAAPIHQIAIVSMGLHLLDNLALDELSQRCSARSRFSFFFSVSPLIVPGGTGSPVNPLAIF